jgi:hypothetical protein
MLAYCVINNTYISVSEAHDKKSNIGHISGLCLHTASCNQLSAISRPAYILFNIYEINWCVINWYICVFYIFQNTSGWQKLNKKCALCS